MSPSASLLLSTVATMFVIVDPFGNLPIFMSLTSKLEKPVRQKVAFAANLLAFTILLVFGFFGYYLFTLLGISPEAMELSGGLLLLIVSLQLLTGEETTPQQGRGIFTMAAVPLGTPLLAGPGSIVALMVQMNAASHLTEQAIVIGGLLLVMLTSWMTMHFADPIMRFLGESGTAVLTKLSGMLLAAIAMQLIISGVLGVVQQAAQSL